MATAPHWQTAVAGRISQIGSQDGHPSLKARESVHARPPGAANRPRADNAARRAASADDQQDRLDQGDQIQQDRGQGELEGDTNVNITIETQNQGAAATIEVSKKKKATVHPQKSLDKYWKNFDPEYLGKVTKILPQSLPASTSHKNRAESSQNATDSYEAAKIQCMQDVDRIIKECRALNQKYTDSHFDIERDLKVTQKRDCLDGLTDLDDEFYDPSDVKRVTDLFEKPTFFADGADSDDIIQGSLGDCWLLSGISVLTCNPDLVDKVCVKRDQEVGVYGFVFYRDGEWHQTIIDDKLYLRAPAFDEGTEIVLQQWGVSQANEEQKYTELFQRGSKALYFAKCRDENETWVPLLEKAFAKAHGGYDALSGGYTGEAIEDLTGGVTTEIYTTNLLSKDKFWKEQLTKNGREFLFGATDASYREWRASATDGWIRELRQQGQVARHAYSVIGTYEGYGERLVKVRNPWGQKEWRGPWGDGSKEWTAEWLQRLDHRFNDDGIFWMSYSDFLRNYKYLDRTRIFGPDWYTAQKWATIQVPFSTTDYQRTKFTIELTQDSETVIVLSQLDDRYYRGFAGQYSFRLQFRVSRSDDESDYIARSRQTYDLERSNNIELYLEKGKYTVFIKVEAYFWSTQPTIEQVIRKSMPHRKEKVTTLGRLYDLAHRKGHPPDETCKEDETISEPTSAQVTSATEAAGNNSVTSESTLDSTIATPVTSTGTAEAPAAPTTGVETADPSTSDPKPAVAAASADEEEDADKNPWNATCVVGLRVYSKSKETTVGVILPPKEAVAAPTLDRDAITKAPQEEAQKKTDTDKAADKEEQKTEPKPEDKKDEEKKDENQFIAVMSRPERRYLPPSMRGRLQTPVSAEETEEDDEDESDE